MPSLRFHVVLVSAALAMLTWSASALGDDPPPPAPPETPSISQYVETVPTSHGGSAAGVGKPRSRPLPRNVAAQLGTRSDPITQRLKEVATSSVYGAPQRDLSRPQRDLSRPTSARTKTAQPKAASSLSAAVSAVSDSGDSHVFWLLAAVIVVTTAMVWATARRHRAQR